MLIDCIALMCQQRQGYISLALIHLLILVCYIMSGFCIYIFIYKNGLWNIQTVFIAHPAARDKELHTLCLQAQYCTFIVQVTPVEY